MKTAAIVPAYNEEQTIRSVISTLLAIPVVDEVLVINDGSEDQTSVFAREFPVKVVDLPVNIGKGGAMQEGVGHTDADIFLFVDADLVGLTKRHVEALLRPVLRRRAVMTVGVFEEGRFSTDLAQKIAPFLSGQRAIRREFWDSMPPLEDTRFGVEMALSRHADKTNAPVELVYLKDLSQVTKEEKRGFAKGILLRLRMYWDIIRHVKP